MAIWRNSNENSWFEAESCPYHPQQGEFVPSPILSAQLLQPKAEEVALGTHALGHNGVRSCGGILLPHHQRSNLDVIVEPPSVDCMTDEHGHQRPVVFWPIE